MKEKYVADASIPADGRQISGSTEFQISKASAAPQPHDADRSTLM
ncbi:hypothetical protein [Sandaracinobacter sp.]